MGIFPCLLDWPVMLLLITKKNCKTQHSPHQWSAEVWHQKWDSVLLLHPLQVFPWNHSLPLNAWEAFSHICHRWFLKMKVYLRDERNKKRERKDQDHSVRVSLVGSYSWPHHTRERKRGGEHFGSPFFLLQLPLVRCSFFLMLFQVLQLQKKSIEFKTWKTYLGRVGEEPEGPSQATIFFLSLATTCSVAMLLLVSSRSFSSKWAEYLQRE